MFWQPNISYEFGPFRLEAGERRLLRDGQVVPLRPKVFDVLLVLLQNSGRFLSKEELMKLVWRDTVVEEGNLARNILSPARKLMAVEVKGDGSTFEAGIPNALFEVRVRNFPGARNNYVVTADGQRFLVTSLLEETVSQPISVVQNWTADLKR